MENDWIGLGITYAFLFAIVLLGELIRKAKDYPSEFTRKVIHIGVGFWGFIAMGNIESRWIAVIPPASFVLINLLSYKVNLIKSMEIEDKRNLGTLYYPASISLLVLLFWTDGLRIVALIGSMVMGLGDGFASIVGRRWGLSEYQIWKHTKTAEGSGAMALFSLFAVVLVLVVYTALPWQTIVLRASVIAVLSMIIEGVSPFGLDNLSVPLGAGAAYWWLYPV